MSTTETDVKKDPQAEVKRNVQLVPGRRKETQFENQDHSITVEQGVTMDDVVKPEFWSNVSQNFRPYDEIRVRVDDGTYYARLIVLSCGRNWARVKVLEYYDLTSRDVDMSQAAASDAYEIAWKGPKHKWSVIRRADGEYLKDEMDDRAAADAYLRDFLGRTA